MAKPPSSRYVSPSSPNPVNSAIFFNGLLKEVERPKYLPSQIIALMREEGYARFNMHDHTQLWKKLEGKNPGKGYGVLVAKTWYWYDRWVDEVRKYCANRGEF